MNDLKHPSSDSIQRVEPQHDARLLWRCCRLAVALILGLLAVFSANTVIANWRNAQHLESMARQNARQYVHAVHPAIAANDGQLMLPGTLRGYTETAIHARATGYVAHWYVDIGAHVKRGQLLAELNTPEIDQELAQAMAQQQQIASMLALAKTSLVRARQLRERDAVSQQELDNRAGAYNQDLANLAAAQANVRRLTELKSFQRITAPIAGVVTQRNVDVGDLVAAGNGNANNDKPLYTLAQTDPLRLYIDVPQTYAQYIHVGQHVRVTQTELPDTGFDGVVTRTAQAIDISTRTLQTEITLPNSSGKLMPGAYVQAALQMSFPGVLTIPGNTLLFRAEGPCVAVIDAHGKVHLKPVSITRDLGQALEVSGQITLADWIVVNPGDALADGDQVVSVASAAGSAL